MSYVPVDPGGGGGGGYVNYYTKFVNVVVNGKNISFQIQNSGNPTTYYVVYLYSGGIVWSWSGTVSTSTTSSVISIPTANVNYSTSYSLYIQTPNGSSSPIEWDRIGIGTGTTSGGGGTSGGSGSSSVGSSSLAQTAHWGVNSQGASHQCVQAVWDMTSYPYYPTGSILYNEGTSWWASCWLRIVCTEVDESDPFFITYTITQQVWGCNYHGFPWHDLKITHTPDGGGTVTDVWYKKDISSTVHRNNGDGADRPWGSGWSGTYYRYTDDWANNVLKFTFAKQVNTAGTRTVTFELTNPGGTVAMSYGTVAHYPISNKITLTLDVPARQYVAQVGCNIPGQGWVRQNSATSNNSNSWIYVPNNTAVTYFTNIQAPTTDKLYNFNDIDQTTGEPVSGATVLTTNTSYQTTITGDIFLWFILENWQEPANWDVTVSVSNTWVKVSGTWVRVQPYYYTSSTWYKAWSQVG